MQRILIVLAVLFGFCLFAQDLRTGTEKLDIGNKLYQEDKAEEAKAAFSEAAGVFDAILDGIASPDEAAYSRYYLATAQYFIAKIDKDNDGFTKASQGFQEAINAFKVLKPLAKNTSDPCITGVFAVSDSIRMPQQRSIRQECLITPLVIFRHF